MPQYAHFDSTAPAPQPVLGWYDTDALKYPNPPPTADLLELTPAQWEGRLSGFWAINNGALVAASQPAPTLAQEAAGAIGAGLAITSTANGALGTFQLTAATQLRFASLLQYYDKFGTFPNKAATITVTDIDGKPHTLTPAQFEALYQTLGDYLTLLEDCIAGIATALPTASNFGTIP